MRPANGRWRSRGAALLLAAGVAAVVLVRADPPPAAAQPAAPPAAPPAALPELALVPGDALGFVHARLSDVWKSDGLKEFRTILTKAGPRALGALDEQFVPALSTVDRMAAFLLPPGKDGKPPGVVVAVALSAPYDAGKVRLTYLPKAVKKAAGGKDYWFDESSGIGVHFASDRLLVLGFDAALDTYFARPPAADGPMAAAVKQAATGTQHLLASVNVAGLPIPPQVKQQLPPELHPILKVQSLTLTLTTAQESRAEVQARFLNDADATEGEKALRLAADVGRKMLAPPRAEVEKLLFGLPGKPFPIPRPPEELPQAVMGAFGIGALNLLDEFLANPPFERKGPVVAVGGSVPTWGNTYVGMTAMSVGLMLPAVQKVREAAARSQGQNNLKQIALAFHIYHDTHGTFPQAAAICDKNGKPLLSWRVALLPYIEQQALYNQFKLDEPWDSEHNKKLIPIVIKTYTSPRFPTKPGETVYKAVVGKEAFFDPDKKIRFADITDGTSNTIMVVEGGDPVPWTKPDEYFYDAKKPLPPLAVMGVDVINVALGDGSVRALNVKAVTEKTLRAMFTRGGGEVVDLP